MLGGKAAKNSAFTSVIPASVFCAALWRMVCNRRCSSITSCLMSSGNAAKNEGSTPSGSSLTSMPRMAEKSSPIPPELVVAVPEGPATGSVVLLEDSATVATSVSAVDSSVTGAGEGDKGPRASGRGAELSVVALAGAAAAGVDSSDIGVSLGS